MTEHERIWLEPVEQSDPFIGRSWCQDNQWGDDGVEYVLAATLESLQRENETRRRAQSYTYIGRDGKAVLARDLEDRAEAAEAEVKRLRGELSFYSCDGSTRDCISGQEDANSVTCGFRARTALASTGGEHHAE